MILDSTDTLPTDTYMEIEDDPDKEYEDCLVCSYIPFTPDISPDQFQALSERSHITVGQVRELKPEFQQLQGVAVISNYRYVLMSHRPTPLVEIYNTETETYSKVLPPVPPMRVNQCIFHRDLAIVFCAGGDTKLVYKQKIFLLVGFEGAKAESRPSREHLFVKMKAKSIHGLQYVFYPCIISKTGREVASFVRLPLSELYFTVEEAHKHNRRQKFSVADYVQTQGMEDYTAVAFTEDYLYAVWANGVMKRLSLDRWFDLVEKSPERFLPFCPSMIGTAGTSLVCVVGFNTSNSKARVSILRGLLLLADMVIEIEGLKESDVSQGFMKSWQQRGTNFFLVCLRSAGFHVYAWRKDTLKFVKSVQPPEQTSFTRRIHSIGVGRFRVFTTDGKYFNLNYNPGF